MGNIRFYKHAIKVVLCFSLMSMLSKWILIAWLIKFASLCQKASFPRLGQLLIQLRCIHKCRWCLRLSQKENVNIFCIYISWTFVLMGSTGGGISAKLLRNLMISKWKRICECMKNSLDVWRIPLMRILLVRECPKMLMCPWFWNPGYATDR